MVIDFHFLNGQNKFYHTDCFNTVYKTGVILFSIFRDLEYALLIIHEEDTFIIKEKIT